MQRMPDILFEWSEMDYKTGERNLKENAPEEVKKQAYEFEKAFHEKTGRRMIDNIALTPAT